MRLSEFRGRRDFGLGSHPDIKASGYLIYLHVATGAHGLGVVSPLDCMAA
ncbi:MAG: hypothetical protein ABL994_16355 [Verrucomicrobiales bacterium]